MAKKYAGWRVGLGLFLGLLLPGMALGGPYLGDWGYLWHPAKGCPCGAYSPLHYWAPYVYKTRAWVHPSNLDEYAPGPSPSVPPQVLIQPYPCRSTLPAPAVPYANPAEYYGLPVSPR